MDDNGKLIFILIVFGLQAVLKEQMKVVNWGITVFRIFVVSYQAVMCSISCCYKRSVACAILIPICL
jgi:hypothetical protein